jgi:signal transduction histidine kinase
VNAIINARLFEQVCAGRERMKMLSKKLVEVQEIERRFLARELHDQVGQVLTGLQLSLEAGKRLKGEALITSLQESQSLVSTLMSQIRELSLRLRPTMLDDMGLLPTLLWYFDKYEHQTGVPVEFRHAGIERRFVPDLETAVYRIIQEALTNAARYANADQLEVMCVARDGGLKILIQDNGIGFDTEQELKKRSTFGLVGMSERANLLGGKLEVSSSPGNGTQVLALFPLDRPLERRKNERDRLTGG